MLIERLKLFRALARARHFGRAAEQCGITQPTLSSALRQLEGDLGVLLVRRGSRFIGLTPEGDQVLNWAQQILSDARSLREEMRASRNGLTGTLRVAVVPTACTMVPRLTEPFCDEHPGVRITVLSRRSVEVMSLLGNFEIDVGITYLDDEPLGNVSSMPLYAERLQLVTASEHVATGRTSISWLEAARLPLCLLTPDMQNRRIIDRHLEAAGTTARPTMESNSIIALLSHVQTGGWNSIMPLNLVETFALAAPIRAIPIGDPDATHTVGLVMQRREPRPPLVTAFLKHVRSSAVNDL